MLSSVKELVPYRQNLFGSSNNMPLGRKQGMVMSGVSLHRHGNLKKCSQSLLKMDLTSVQLIIIIIIFFTILDSTSPNQ